MQMTGKLLVQMTVCLVVYFGIGIIFYTQVEGWSVVDALYFQMVCASTVGYGDISPTGAEGSDTVSPGMAALSRIFTLVWIFIGICVVFGQLAAFAIWLIHPLSSGLRNWAEKRFPPKKESLVDIDGDGTPDYAIPPGPFVYYLKGLIAPITVVLLVQLIWAAVFCELEGWDYGSAVYHCFITATTVGFGDVTIVTDGGKMWAFFHIFLSVALMATVITDVGELRSKRAQLLKRMLLMKASLDLEMMKSLDKDGKGVDRVEFVVGMMERLGLAEWQDAVPFNKLFEELDADGSGKLDEKDMERAREKLESKNRKMESNLVQARMRNKSQHHRDAAPSSPTSTKGSHPSLPGVAAVQSSVPAALDGGVIEVPTIEVTVEKA